MDPLTIFQVVSAALSLSDAVVSCITSLAALRDLYHKAPVIITSIIEQLNTVRKAQLQFSHLNPSDSAGDPRYQLGGQIGNPFDSLDPILRALAQQLKRYESGSGDWDKARIKFRFLIDESAIRRLSNLLDKQVNALTLLLQVMQL
jgi:hypothetical protein